MEIALWWLACAPSPDLSPVDVHHAPGWAVAVPVGARVDASPELVRVDNADGSAWFDVRWVPPDAAPLGVAYDLVAGTCETVRWEDPADMGGTLVYGGECSIRGRRHWAAAVLEPHEGKRLGLVWVGDEAKVTFEDAWVALLTTTLTLQGAGSPLPTAAVPDLRRTIRAIAADSKNVGHAQVPGGGTLWKATGEAFPEVWQARQKAGMPATF